MGIFKVLGTATLGFGLALVGCSDGADGNGGPGSGSGDFSVLPPLTAHQVVGNDLEPSGTADSACLGERPRPVGDGPVTFTLEIRDFQTDAIITGACVEFYGDNEIPIKDSCTDGQISDAQGRIQVTDEDGGLYAYRVFPTDEALGVIQANVPTPTAGTVDIGRSVSLNTANVIPLLFTGLQRDPARAVFSGAVYDCNDARVEGANARVIQGGNVVQPGTGTRDPRYAYHVGGLMGLPAEDVPWTNDNGLFLALNIPVGAEGEIVQIVACGKPDGQNLEVLGCEETRSFADTVNIASLRPVHTDGSSCPDICN